MANRGRLLICLIFKDLCWLVCTHEQSSLLQQPNSSATPPKTVFHPMEALHASHSFYLDITFMCCSTLNDARFVTHYLLCWCPHQCKFMILQLVQSEHRALPLVCQTGRNIYFNHLFYSPRLLVSTPIFLPSSPSFRLALRPSEWLNQGVIDNALPSLPPSVNSPALPSLLSFFNVFCNAGGHFVTPFPPFNNHQNVYNLMSSFSSHLMLYQSTHLFKSSPCLPFSLSSSLEAKIFSSVSICLFWICMVTCWSAMETKVQK